MKKVKIVLKENEMPAKVDTGTGEIIVLDNVKTEKIKENPIIKFSYGAAFNKVYFGAIECLLKRLSAIELKIVLVMANNTEFGSNSLNPLNDKVSNRQLAEYFDISRNLVGKSMLKILDLGIYANLKYYHNKRGKVQEWIFNPFIAFNGKFISESVKNYFETVKITQIIKDRIGAI